MMMPDNGRRPSGRLPVNPRRHRVAPEDRKRVTTACNGCNVRRIKCSGEQPCRQCASSSRECVYPTPVEKISVPRNELEDLRRQAEVLEQALKDVVPDATIRQQMLQQLRQTFAVESPAASASASSPTPSLAAISTTLGGPSLFSPFSPDLESVDISSLSFSLADPEHAVDHSHIASPIEARLLRDQSGIPQFVGETSQAAFLDHIKEFISTALPVARQADGVSPEDASFLNSLGRSTPDCHQEEIQVDPLWLPPPANLAIMLAEARRAIQPGMENGSGGGIYYFGDLSTLPLRPAPQEEVDADVAPFRHLAFQNAALALACHYASPRRTNPPPSEAYFARASHLLGTPLDISINDASSTRNVIATLTLMGLYLFETDRPNAAHDYAVAAVQRGISHGVHRGWADEAVKRTFWTAYIFERKVTLHIGRSTAVRDEDIRLMMPTETLTLSMAAGVVAHIELARISGHVSSAATRMSSDVRAPGVLIQDLHAVLWSLDQWKASLPTPLQLSSLDTGDASLISLHIYHRHLYIIASRSLFFAAVRRSFAERIITRRSSYEAYPHVEMLRRCVDAALEVIHLAKIITPTLPSSSSATLPQRRRKMSRQDLHAVLDAATYLMLDDLASEAMVKAEVDSEHDVDYAIRLMDAEADLGGEFGRYGAETLRRLRSLTARLMMTPNEEASIDAGLGAFEGAGLVEQPMMQMASMSTESTHTDMSEWMGSGWPM